MNPQSTAPSTPNVSACLPASSLKHSQTLKLPITPPKMWDNTGQSETSDDNPDRTTNKPPHRVALPQTPSPVPDVPSTTQDPPRETREEWVESETFADGSYRNLIAVARHAVGSRPSPLSTMPDPPLSETCEICVESETFADVSDRNLNNEPRDTSRLRRPTPYSLRPMPDNRPAQARILCVESETFDDMSDRDLIAVPRHAVGSRPPPLSTMPDPPLNETCEICVESGTFPDKQNRNTSRRPLRMQIHDPSTPADNTPFSSPSAVKKALHEPGVVRDERGGYATQDKGYHGDQDRQNGPSGYASRAAQRKGQEGAWNAHHQICKGEIAAIQDDRCGEGVQRHPCEHINPEPASLRRDRSVPIHARPTLRPHSCGAGRVGQCSDCHCASARSGPRASAVGHSPRAVRPPGFFPRIAVQRGTTHEDPLPCSAQAFRF